ncbi:MAG: glucose-1-phosphate thymidylyltransferase [Thermoplasmata archaeon]|nr:MAG: glucose-1-phosphate thymidylyltransferase [Thermoplasmata archaeon]
MKCVILAAGEGKRMHPLTYTRPKVMLPIANKPVLEWNMANAIKAGFREFIFVVGYKSEMVRNYFGDGAEWGINIEYVNQGEPLGTAHAIKTVEKFVGDDFIVLCGDTIFGEEDIMAIKNREMAVGLTEIEDAREYGIVEMEGKKVIKIHEKMDEPISNLVNGGIYRFNKKIFEFIEKTGKSPRGEYEITDSINLMVKEEEIEGLLLKKWRDVVYPWHILDANEEMLKKIKGGKESEIEENAVIKGNVIIGKGSKIMSGSYIEGPVAIGKNCKIGPNCYIRPFTAIGNNCHIGNACEVKNSVVMNNTNIPHQNYVGDSVIGQNCNLGAGTKIANLRLDKKDVVVSLNGKKVDTKRRKLGAIIGDNVQTGINATINIGSIIGNDVFIGPGASVSNEIKPFSRIM